jgi:hypothetical protein
MHPMTSKELARLRAADLEIRARREHPRSADVTSRRSRRGRNQKRRTGVRPSDLVAWVLSLPWVVERPFELAPGVRSFAVDCPPLRTRRLFLVIGLGSTNGASPLSVIVPREVSREIENSGWGRRFADMPAGHVLMGVDADDASADVEALVLTAYRYAMA